MYNSDLNSDSHILDNKSNDFDNKKTIKEVSGCNNKSIKDINIIIVSRDEAEEF
jgi:hypothetical protein